MVKKVAKYFVGFWLLLAIIIEWVLDMCVKVIAVIHQCFNELTVALLKKYNEFNS